MENIAIVNYYRNGKRLNRHPVKIEMESWRITPEQITTVSGFEICWYNHPDKVTIDYKGFRYYQRITYYKVFPNKQAEKENRYTSLAPIYKFTCRRVIKAVTA